MKPILFVAIVALTGCSGPIPLNRAIWPMHTREIYSIQAQATPTPRAAWYAYKAQQESKPIAEIESADTALSTTRNPFHANTDGAAVSRGAIIFRDHCARCHGEDARGDGPFSLPDHPATNFHSFGHRFAATLHGGAPRSWFRKINGGYGDEVQYPDGPSQAMPAFGDTLAREQIWLAITYLQSLDMYAKAPPDENNGD